MAIIKTYRAKTAVSLNIVLPSKKSQHITFTPLSNGTSTYTTDNETIQQALENHYRFGSLFRLYSTRDTEGQTTTVVEEKKNVKPAQVAAVTKITVSDIAAAKDYLADKFGVSRTAMRSTTAILQQAKAHGIEFEGI